LLNAAVAKVGKEARQLRNITKQKAEGKKAVTDRRRWCYLRESRSEGKVTVDAFAGWYECEAPLIPAPTGLTAGGADYRAAWRRWSGQRAIAANAAPGVADKPRVRKMWCGFQPSDGGNAG
jgi:hypothetical protein